jgi:hypothetical protein
MSGCLLRANRRLSFIHVIKVCFSFFICLVNRNIIVIVSYALIGNTLVSSRVVLLVYIVLRILNETIAAQRLSENARLIHFSKFSNIKFKFHLVIVIVI